MARRIKANCTWCGKQAVVGEFCGPECEVKQAEMVAKPFRRFRSYQQAGAYLGKDVRTIRKYEGILFAIDRSLPSLHIKPQTCRVCSGTFAAHEGRHGYCLTCSAAGAGRRSQARIIAERHRGEGNPNYVDGGAKQTFRHQPAGKRWAASVLARDGACRCCESTETLHAHHVVPVALFPNWATDLDNGITLCGHHHTELHRLRLDLQLLPTLYASSADGLPLHEALCLQPEFRALRLLPVTPYRRRRLLPVVPRDYRRLQLDLHPEFARRVLGLTE